MRQWQPWLAFVALLCAVGVNAAETIKLGLNYPSTGRYKEQGLAQARGALLAIEEINANGGLNGQTLELLTANTASKPDKAVANVDQLVEQGAAMLFGGASSAVAIAAGKQAAQHERIYFGTLTYANGTTGINGHRHMFRESYNAWMAAKALAQYLKHELNGKRLFYLTADYNWGHSTEASLRNFTGTDDTTQHPGVRTQYPRPRASHFQQALQQAKDSGAEVLMLVQFGDDMVKALNEIERMGLKDSMTIVVPNLTHGMARRAGASIMQGVIGAVPWSWQVPGKYGYQQGQAFVNAFVKRFNTYPSSSAASAYSIVHQFKQAAERAGSVKTEALIKALEGHRYIGLKDEQYWRSFDHQNIQSVYVVRAHTREHVLQSPLREDFFDVLMKLPAEQAARTEEEWQAVRRTAGMSLQLR